MMRANVSVAGKVTRMPNGFGRSSGSFKLCWWTISISWAARRKRPGVRILSELRHGRTTPRRCYNLAAMARVVQAAEFFVVGGPVPPDRPSYVERTADGELEAALHARRLCYVLGAHGIGK